MRIQGRGGAGAFDLRLRALRTNAGFSARALAAEGSARPMRALGWLLALNAAAAAVFTGLGVASGDEALFFRELMPGTWLSFAQLAGVAFVAREIHRRVAPGQRLPSTFFGLAALVFVVFAADEILGTSQHIGTWLNQEGGLAPAGAFRDVGAVLLTLLFAAAALVLLPRALVLLRHPLALALLIAGALLGAASQGLDSFVAATPWEFVAEESLKLGAEAFLLAGFLVLLRDAGRERRAAARPRPA